MAGGPLGARARQGGGHRVFQLPLHEVGVDDRLRPHDDGPWKVYDVDMAGVSLVGYSEEKREISRHLIEGSSTLNRGEMHL